MVKGRSQTCERMRGSISAALDGELSEFESIRLAAHLDGCDSCREFETAARISTTALRAAPLEPLNRPVGVPSRRRRSAVLGVPAAAAAAVVMIAAGGVFEAIHSSAAVNRPVGAAFNSPQEYRAMLDRQLAANYAQLLLRRAQVESNQIPRHPGFQNP